MWSCCGGETVSRRILVVLAAMAVVIAIPFVLKPKENLLAPARMIRWSSSRRTTRRSGTSSAWPSPTTTKGKPAARFASTGGFRAGQAEIARYLKGEYYAAFEREWTLGGRALDVGGLPPRLTTRRSDPRMPSMDTPAQAARRAFLASDHGIGMNVFSAAGHMILSSRLRRAGLSQAM